MNPAVVLPRSSLKLLSALHVPRLCPHLCATSAPISEQRSHTQRHWICRAPCPCALGANTLGVSRTAEAYAGVTKDEHLAACPSLPRTMTTEPPPTYDDHLEASQSTVPTTTEPAVNIIPGANAIGFQKGFLGADSERAAIEGELQVKGADGRRWRRVFVPLYIYIVSVY